MQIPFTHVAVPAHDAHDMPEIPHCELVCALDTMHVVPDQPHFASLCMENCTQVFPSQQPEQLFASQPPPSGTGGCALPHALNTENTARETQPSRVTSRMPAP